MNRLYFSIIGIILFLAVVPVFAQENDDSEKRLLEREIKTSGLYLYGEAVGKNKSEATKLAKSMLISEINKEVMNHPEWQFAKTIKADDIEYTTDMIDLARGNRTRVIAFLKKDGIHAIFSDDSPKIKLSDKKEDKKKEQNVITTTTQEKKVEVKAAVTDTNDLTAEQLELLKSIVDADSATEINKILRANKTKGKVAYGGINTLTNSSNVYILVYTSNNEIIAVLDKGDGTERKDIRSGEYKNTTDIYKGNMRIWFQLF